MQDLEALGVQLDDKEAVIELVALAEGLSLGLNVSERLPVAERDPLAVVLDDLLNEELLLHVVLSVWLGLTLTLLVRLWLDDPLLEPDLVHETLLEKVLEPVRLNDEKLQLLDREPDWLPEGDTLGLAEPEVVRLELRLGLNEELRVSVLE